MESTAGGTGPTVPNERLTHTYLRVLMVAMPAMMLVALLAAWFVLGMSAPSLSEYYDNALRDFFVGTMFAIAACLVAYKGNALEDLSLNAAGFYALFVALVPAGVEDLLALPPDHPRAVSVDAVRMTLGVVLAVAVAFVAFDRRWGLWAPDRMLENRFTRALLYLGVGFLVVFLGLVTVRLVEGATFGGVHLVAAVGLIANLAIAVSSHGWPERTGCSRAEATDRRGRSHDRTYRVIFALMVAGLPLWGVLALLGYGYRVLVVEVYEIALFMAFWGLETARTWPPRRAAPQDTR